MNDETQNYTQEDINATKGLACLSYIGLLFLIPMLTNKDSAFTKFHVNQGIVVFIVSIAVGFVSGILTGIGGAIPGIGWLLTLIAGLVPIAVFILMIIGIVNASQGKAVRLPIIGNIQILK